MIKEIKIPIYRHELQFDTPMNYLEWRKVKVGYAILNKQLSIYIETISAPTCLDHGIFQWIFEFSLSENIIHKFKISSCKIKMISKYYHPENDMYDYQLTDAGYAVLFDKQPLPFVRLHIQYFAAPCLDNGNPIYRFLLTNEYEENKNSQ